MYVVASFRLNKNLERAISELEYYGISRTKILALPLVTRAEQNNYGVYRGSLFESAPILVTIFALFGAIYGFILHWGPILWGLIGIGLGVALGLTIDFIRTKSVRNKGMNEDGKLSEVFLLINCSSEEQGGKVQEILWKWLASGISTLVNQAKEEGAR